ncbi:Tumor necrosis factor alpha-induced protein [Parelaphostrongylus tenuis]|uniref:Tumor necrosis factor alpha-induced protein n=1 Tax=Parelaphostrongylus tenuis TaxID=148309 RepID=A0AAD5WE75_PARTN|nr:Tumor necrosis factor alpha-induced protein [Parelaphostrongylus tenuis]
MQRHTTRVLSNKTNLVVDHSEEDGSFSASSLSIKAQKKIASKLSTRKVTKLFLNNDVDTIFDSLYNVLRTYFSKKDAEKIVKNIIKLAVKMALLARNDLLSTSERKQLAVVQKQLHALTLTIISFVQVKYSFEKSHLIELIKNIQQSLAPLVSLKLSDNSSRRLEHVILHVTNNEFLEGLFRVDGPHSKVLSEFISALENMLDSENL